MGSLLSARIRKRGPSCGFSATLERLDGAWRHEARFRLLLLSIILALCLLSGNWFLTLTSHLPTAEVNSSNSRDQAARVVGLTVVLFAVLRIWPEVRRCRPRIAELQNVANQIEYLAARHALGIEVSTQEWQRAFEMAKRLLGASGHTQTDENIHPILELITRFFPWGNGKSESQASMPSPTFIGFDAMTSQPESEKAGPALPIRRPAQSGAETYDS